MKKIKNQLVGLDPRFHYRGLNQTRIETFSDAVFAFSVTLVVLSSSVPKTFAELMESFREIIPFFFCVVLIVVIWYQHYTFFLRYGMQDKKTVLINTFLLFVLLIYVYPLKFLMTFLFELYAGMANGDLTRFNTLYADGVNARTLMMAYGFGAAAIFVAMAWLYRHAYNRREALGLDEYESYSTKISIWVNLLLSAIPFFSGLISLIEPFGQTKINFIIAGFIYMLYPPVMIFFGRRFKKQTERRFGANYQP
ncbi:MAG: hypothetical protein Tsb0034_06960 [Ekhidna sp.]